MSEIVRLAQDASGTKEIREIAEALAKYKLGICIPHMHDEQTGELVALPSGIISCERNLKVSFEDAAVAEGQSMVPIAWRWNGVGLEICASCCTGDGGGSSTTEKTNMETDLVIEVA